MSIHKQHDPIREYVRQLREARIALPGRNIRRPAAAGKRLESQQQPVGVVGDFKDEFAVALKGKRDSGSFSLVSD